MADVTRFTALARLLHWLMAAMVFVMLFVGVLMASTAGPGYAGLVALHRPLGMAVLVLAIGRLINRLATPTPPLPRDLPAVQKLAAHGSHVALYALMFAMPLVGWGMLSAGGYPVIMWPGFALPALLPRDVALFALLRQTHTVLGFGFFALVLAHLAAALVHGLIRRDGVFQAMGWR